MKKLFAIALCLAMLLSLAACASGSGGSSAAATPPAASGAGSQTEGEAGGPPYTEMVYVDMFINMAWWEANQWEGLRIPDKISENTGVVLNIEVAADDKQLPLFIASGDLPEMIYTADNITRLSDDNLCWDWQTLVDEYEPDWEINPKRSALYTQPNGKFYTMLNNMSTEEEWNAEPLALQNPGGFVANKAMYEAVGSPEIKTLDDLIALFQAVKAEFPEVVPVRINNTGSIETWWREQFGVKSAVEAVSGGPFFKDADGNLRHAIYQDNYVEYYKFMAKLNQLGLVNKEDYSLTNTGVSEAGNALKAGTAFGYAAQSRAADGMNVDPQVVADGLEFMMLPHGLTDMVKCYSGGMGWAGMFVSKNNQSLAETTRFIRYMWSDEGTQLGMWGEEGVDWEWADAEQSHPEFLINRLDQNDRLAAGRYWFGLFGSTAVAEGLFNYDPNSLGTPVMLEAKPYYEYTELFAALQPAADSSELNTLTKVADYLRTEQVKCFLAESDAAVEAQYAAMVAAVEDMGLAEVEAWATQRYAELESFIAAAG